MKNLVVVFLIVFSMHSAAETIMQDSHRYTSGERKPFSLNWDKELKLCVKIPGSDRKSLKEQCSKRGGCLRISDRTNKQGYGYTRNIITVDYDKIDAGALDFVVSNEFDEPHNIIVTAFNPNFKIDESFKLLTGKSRELRVKSNKDLAVFARIPVKNVNPLVAACSPNSSCLKLEFFNRELNFWSWVASDSGIGKTLSPDENGEIVFRVINEYPMAVDVRATAADPLPKACEWE